ncbi:Tudor/PWWP/MBT [Backusella circina FSU 941]|nr:Tudor/PWWP/MBT [Backusella circina FSU 941]
MPPKEYSPGDTVFAKLKGYPWWPARVEDDKQIPAKILKQKGKSKAAFYTVFFYGSRDYGFFGPDCIRPFDRTAVERDLKAKKFKTKDLEHAIHQALDPSLLKAEEEEEEEEEEATEEMEEEEDELMEEEEGIKPEKKERKTTKAKKPAAAATKSNNNTRKRTGNNKSTVKEESAKRARLEEESEVDSKKREEDIGLRRASSTTSLKSEEPTHPNNSSNGLEQFKKTPEYKKTYHCRHKLQKLIYEKRPGEIPKEDYQRISNVLKEIEDTNMTFDLLRYTKIGKVLKYGCGYTFEDDQHDIKQRSVNLMRKWKAVLTPTLERSAVEQQHKANGHHS